MSRGHSGYDPNKQQWYNAKTGQWQDERPEWWGTRNLLPHQRVGRERRDTPVYETRSYASYAPTKPWEGVPKERYWNTWLFLVQLYFADTYHRDTVNRYGQPYSAFTLTPAGGDRETQEKLFEEYYYGGE